MIWREPSIESFSKYPTITLHNNPDDISELVDVDAPIVATDFVFDGKGLDEFLEVSDTAAFIVIQNGTVNFEKYFNGAGRDKPYTAFSITKSFVSALLGIAMDGGYIDSVSDSVTQYIPELDEQFDAITIEHLLMMSSGIKYSETEILGMMPAWWSDQYKATFSPDMRKTLLSLDVAQPPVTEFSYNNYNTGLLGLIIERATGQSLTDFAQRELWQPMGAEYSASWSVDSEALRFPQTDSGLNARAIDLARFGLLYLNGGQWNNKRIVSSEWVGVSTSLANPLLEVKNQQYLDAEEVTDDIKQVIESWRYYYLWWGIEREDHAAVFANGHLGQFIYIVPENHLVIVRTGFSWGKDMNDDKWLQFFYELVQAIGTR